MEKRRRVWEEVIAEEVGSPEAAERKPVEEGESPGEMSPRAQFLGVGAASLDTEPLVSRREFPSPTEGSEEEADQAPGEETQAEPVDWVVVEPSPEPGVPPKLEQRTDLSYVTLRNWSAVYEREFPDKLDVYRHPEPDRAHISHLKFLETALGRIDADKETAPPIDVSGLTPQGRIDARDLLAQSLWQCAREAYTSRITYEDLPDIAAKVTTEWESAAAEALAPYRHDREFLREAAEAADQAQLEGRPFVAMQPYEDGPIIREVTMTVPWPPEGADDADS
jgi:hypothetical protein